MENVTKATGTSSQNIEKTGFCGKIRIWHSKKKSPLREEIITDAARLAGYLKEGKAMLKERRRKPKKTLDAIFREMEEYDGLAEKYEELVHNYYHILPREKMNDAEKIVNDKATEICQKFQDSEVKQAKYAGFASVVKPQDMFASLGAIAVYCARIIGLGFGIIMTGEAVAHAVLGKAFSITEFAIGIGLGIVGVTLDHLIASTKSKIKAVERYEKMKEDVKTDETKEKRGV
ncbi:MAG: hypothetical protein NTX79_01865 [Candidatus Micrarchaeota archaeon]|nr:hypothetical protein [Candidatus Micrarchaeota archaeon]